MSTEATPENLREAASWDPNPDDPDGGFALLRAAADRIEELEDALRSIVDGTEAAPENMPDLDGYTVREAWEHGWHRGYAAACVPERLRHVLLIPKEDDARIHSPWLYQEDA